MVDRIPIREIVLVEGKYDKITLSQIIDATIMTTDGFAIFHQEKKRALLRRMGEERGIILLTDSDGGGRQIRAYLTGVLPSGGITQLYVPRIEGKEGRKRVASRSGVLGVEGMKADVLRRLFEPYRAGEVREAGEKITQTDLFEAGLLGNSDATEKRRVLCERLALPPLNGKQLLSALNALMTREAFLKTVEQ